MTAFSPTSLPKWPFPRRTPPPTFRRLATGILLLVALSVLLALLLEGYSGPPLPEYSVGDIARADVVAPYDLVFKDEHATEVARAAARDNVLPVYRFAPEKNIERAAAVAEAFQQCRTLLESSLQVRVRPTRFSRLPVAAALHNVSSRVPKSD